jgi:uncharacterized membrane protein
LRRALAALVPLVVLLAVAPAAVARSLTVVNADIEMALARDGSLLVVEHLTTQFDGDWEAMYRDIPLRFGERIVDVRVLESGEAYNEGGCTSEGCIDRIRTFGVGGSLGDSPRIVWHHKASDEIRTFDVAYRVVSTNAFGEIDGVPAGATVAYDDVIDVAWTVWGDQWEFDLEHLTASFSDSALDPENDLYRVWGHPRDVEGVTARDPDIARLSADDVESGEAVEFRITVPRTPGQGVSGARQVSGDGLPQIIAFEQGLDDDFNSPWSKFKRWVAENIWLVCGALAAIAVLLLLLLRWLARERPVSVPRYLSGPPEEGVSPALAYGLAYEGRDTSNAALATLLDLTDRGYYVATSATTKEEKQDLAIGKNVDRSAYGHLEGYEREVLSFFDDVVEGYSVPVSEMRDRIPEHSATWRAKWQSMTGALNDAEAGKLAWDRNLNWARLLLAGLMAAAFALVTLILLDIEGQWVAPVAIGIVVLLVILVWPSRQFKRLSADSRERSAKWQAFARWTEDFPRLEDDPPATLALWKRILVYGVAFGTAERMIKSGRIPAPVTTEASNSTGWHTYAFTGAFYSSSFDGGSFSSGFASQVAPESSSSGGGGGFSGGGGGGFSGGGGGGGW